MTKTTHGQQTISKQYMLHTKLETTFLVELENGHYI
jgi:hypothetical protein